MGPLTSRIFLLIGMAVKSLTGVLERLMNRRLTVSRPYRRHLIVGQRIRRRQQSAHHIVEAATWLHMAATSHTGGLVLIGRDCGGIASLAIAGSRRSHLRRRSGLSNPTAYSPQPDLQHDKCSVRRRTEHLYFHPLSTARETMNQRSEASQVRACQWDDECTISERVRHFLLGVFVGMTVIVEGEAERHLKTEFRL